MKFTKYSLKLAEAHAAVQAELPAKLGLSAATGLLSTWAVNEVLPRSIKAIAKTRMPYVELLFFISVSFKRLWAIIAR